MCGISAVIDFKGGYPLYNILQKMNNRIIHRGPDSDGITINGHVGLGHRRLAILDLSETGHQPMHDSGLILSYNGELYNYIELRDELIANGHTFKSNSDSEVLLKSYKEWGCECVRKFNGMWAFIIYDTNRDVIFVSRDYFGIKPLYRYEFDKRVFFFSEVKQLMDILEEPLKLDACSISDFLQYGLLNHNDRTMFSQVRSIKPGHNLLIDVRTGEQRSTKWYNLTEDDISKDQNELHRRGLFKQAFLKSVRIRMRSDVRVGACLSGGLDSSSIVAAASKINPNILTITSTYGDKSFDETPFSDAVAQRLGLQNTITSGDSIDFQEVLKTIIYHQDQPIPTGSHISEFNVFKAAHKYGCIVMLDGQGADEYLAGYPDFHTTYFLELLTRLKMRKFWTALREYRAVLGCTWIQIVQAEWASIIYYPLIRILKRLFKFNRSLIEDSLVQASNTKLLKHGRIRDLTQQQLFETSLPYQLHSEDRNSMCFSIESRLPFLDPHLVELGHSLPSSSKIKNGYRKHILRALDMDLPHDVLWRRDKMGFVAPDEFWLLTNSQFVQSHLHKANELGFVKSEIAEKFRDFVNGKRQYTPLFWRAMSLSIFCTTWGIQSKTWATEVLIEFEKD